MSLATYTRFMYNMTGNHFTVHFLDIGVRRSRKLLIISSKASFKGNIEAKDSCRPFADADEEPKSKASSRSVDYVRFPPAESAMIWHQRKRPVATPVPVPTPCARVSPVVENMLDSILDYDLTERIKPVTPAAVTTVGYSP